MLDIEEDIRSLQLDSAEETNGPVKLEDVKPGVVDKSEHMNEEHLKSKQKVEEKSKEKEIEWGKGLAQKREAEAQLKELEIEKDKLLPATGSKVKYELDKASGSHLSLLKLFFCRFFDREGKLRAIYGGGRCHHLFSTFGADGIPSCGFGFGDAIVVFVQWGYATTKKTQAKAAQCAEAAKMMLVNGNYVGLISAYD
ncbi:Histidine--tRNA ligase/mitochondrial [Arachis hypogaea]|nr:Histidine--tRNA ligase/mitochondrial [Arachis hypogaea]